MDAESLWKAVLGELEVTLSKANFVTWFKKTSLLKNVGGNITISVPNVFTQTWFKNNYHGHIQTAFKNILGKVESIEYVVGSHLELVEEQVIEIVVEEEVQLVGQGGLNPKYLFENFVVGSSNKLAHAVAKSVSKQPGTEYNPLFIYGGVGLGKTHLIQAIGNEISKKFPNKKVVYLNMEAFMNEFIQSIKFQKTDSFKNKYRKADVLLFDDVQILMGKTQTQEELFHTFNTLYQDGKQIILSSDRHPKAIPTLEDRLRSRFESGMIADIQPPELETRIVILQNKAKYRGYDLPLEIIDYIARNIHQNVRELEGALTRVIAYTELNGRTPEMNIVSQIVGSSNSLSKKKIISIKAAIEKIAAFYDLSQEELIGSKRSREIVVPRQVLMYILREEMKLSYPKIGTEIGGKDHTTVMHAVNKISKQIDSDESLRHDISLIKERIYSA